MSGDIKKLLESIDSISVNEQNDFPRQAMDYGSGMKPHKESDHAAMDRSNFENDPRWTEYDKLQAHQEFTQAKELMNRMRYEHHMDEDIHSESDVWPEYISLGFGMKWRKIGEPFLQDGIPVCDYENTVTGRFAVVNHTEAEIHAIDENIEEASTHNGTYYDTHIDMKMYDLGVKAFKNYLSTGKKQVPEFQHRDQKTSFEQGWNDCVLMKGKYGKSKFMSFLDRYLSKKDESIEENVKWNSFHKWYDSSPKDVVSRTRKADTNFLKNIASVDSRDLGGAAKLQHAAAVRELQRRGEMVPESTNRKNQGKDDMINESMWDEDVGTDPVVICMHKDGHKMYFKEFHSNGNYYWTANKDDARDFESEDAAHEAIRMIKAHDPAVYKMGLVGKTHGEKPYPIYCEPMHEVAEDLDYSNANASPLTHGFDNLDMDEDWSADEYNRQKMIDAPKSRQHNPVSEPGKHSYIPRSHELDEEDNYGQDEIIQDLSGKLQGPWPLDGEGHETEMEDSAMDADPDSVIDEFYDTMPSKGIEKMPKQVGESKLTEKSAPGQEAWIKANKGRFVKEYGKKKGLEVLYATAWKRSKKNESVNSDPKGKESGNKEYPKRTETEKAYYYKNKKPAKTQSEKEELKDDKQIQAFESMFAEAMETPMKKKNKKINESIDFANTENTKSIVDSLGSMLKNAGIASQKAEYTPYVVESDVFSRMKDYFDIESPEDEEGSDENSGSGSGSGEENCDDNDQTCDTEVDVSFSGEDDGEGHFSGLADKIKNLASGKEPGKHFGGLADKLNALKDGEVEEERETPNFKGIGDKLRNHFKKDKPVTEGTSVAVHKAYPGKVSQIGSDLQKYHSNNGQQISSTQQGDYVHFHLPAAGHNTADAVKRTLQGHEGHPAYSPENVSESKMNEDLSATLTMSKCEDGKSMNMTISDPSGDEIDQLLSLAGICQPKAVAVVSAKMEPTSGEAPEQAQGGYQGAYEMVGEAEEQYEDPDQDPTGEYGDTHYYDNMPKKDVYDMDTQINKGSDLNAPKGEYAKEFPGDNRMNTAKRDAAFESAEMSEGWMDKFKKVVGKSDKGQDLDDAIAGLDRARNEKNDVAKRFGWDKAIPRSSGYGDEPTPIGKPNKLVWKDDSGQEHVKTHSTESVSESKLWKEYKGIK